jgi:hypothetical protein
MKGKCGACRRGKVELDNHGMEKTRGSVGESECGETGMMRMTPWMKVALERHPVAVQTDGRLCRSGNQVSYEFSTCGSCLSRLREVEAYVGGDRSLKANGEPEDGNRHQQR